MAAQTDASGDYRIDGIPQGLYDVRFRRDGYRSWAHPGLSVVGPGEAHHVNVVLDEGRRVTGRVVSESGEPILGATALESAGITIDPANQTLKQLPAISLK